MVTAVRTESTRRTSTERLLIWLEGLLALGAYGGALGLISGGVDLGPATADLPFGSTLFAGLALGIVNGILPTVVLVGAVRGRTWAPMGHRIVGVALIGWIVVQVAFLGWPPHWLQTTYFIYGWVILVLAIRVPIGPRRQLERRSAFAMIASRTQRAKPDSIDS